MNNDDIFGSLLGLGAALMVPQLLPSLLGGAAPAGAAGALGAAEAAGAASAAMPAATTQSLMAQALPSAATDAALAVPATLQGPSMFGDMAGAVLDVPMSLQGPPMLADAAMPVATSQPGMFGALMSDPLRWAANNPGMTVGGLMLADRMFGGGPDMGGGFAPRQGGSYNSFGVQANPDGSFQRTMEVRNFADGGLVDPGAAQGDGRDDATPAVIDGKRPARLSSGEYVVPARAVSALGRGSTMAGAKKLDRMVKSVSRGGLGSVKAR